MPTWIGDNGTWTNAANWSGGAPNAPGVLAEIPVSSNGGTLLIGIPEFNEITVGRIRVTATGTSGVSIRGSSADSGAGSGTLVFNNFGGSTLEFIANAGGGPLVFSSAFGLNMRLDNELLVQPVGAGTTVRFDLDVSGVGEIVKIGEGVLELNGTNSYGGGTYITAGLLYAAGDAALGTGRVLINNNATFRSSGTIDNAFHTSNNLEGSQGGAQILAASGTTMTLTGALHHVSKGTLSFGSAGLNSIIVASFSSVTNNATESSFNIAGGTLRLGSAYVAANLFERPGNGVTYISDGATLDTGGFATVISGDVRHTGSTTLRSTGGALNLTVNGSIQYVGAFFNLTIQGTAGVDQIVLNADVNSVITGVSFADWTDGVDLITLNGTNAENSLMGTAQRDTINGYDGDDYLRSGGGIDTIYGGGGNDFVELGLNSNGSMVDGGAGNDTLYLSGSTVTLGAVSGFERIRVESGATLHLTGTQFVNGFASNSVLSGAGTIRVDLVSGAPTVFFKLMTEEAGSDVKFTINGSSGADIIKANDFTLNTINGGDGTDLLNGGNSGDIINGGNGIDKIRGGGGVDVMTGGAGADIFKYRNFSDAGTGIFADVINDFVSGEDKLNFRRLDADPGTAGHQSFSFIGTAAFVANGSAQIRYVDTGNDLRVDVDANGDGAADMSIVLLGAGAGPGLLFASDFLL